MSKKIALDVESTIADIATPFRDEYQKRHGVEVGEWTEWDFEDAEFEMRDFMEITSSNWKHRLNNIPPTEKGIMAKVHEIKKCCIELDIVTGRQGFDREIQAWLDTQGVLYDNFYVVHNQQQKSDLGYDYLIDDSPQHVEALNDSQMLFLYDQPYNRHVEESDTVMRIDSLTDVVSYLH